MNKFKNTSSAQLWTTQQNRKTPNAQLWLPQEVLALTWKSADVCILWSAFKKKIDTKNEKLSPVQSEKIYIIVENVLAVYLVNKS